MLLNNKKLLISIISGNPKSIFDDLIVAEEEGIDGVHFDVMDGIFVPRLGLYPELLHEIRLSSKLFIEVHCMLHQPSQFVDLFIDAGADRIVFHVETSESLDLLIDKVLGKEIKVGLVLNPNTPLEKLLPFLHIVNSVTLMAIQPGVPRHPFIEATYSKLESLASMIKELGDIDIEISIDGGVTFENYLNLFELGASSLVCGSGTVYHPKSSLRDNIRALKIEQEMRLQFPFH